MINPNELKIGQNIYDKDGFEFEIIRIIHEKNCYSIVDISLTDMSRTKKHLDLLLDEDQCAKWFTEKPKQKAKYYRWSMKQYSGDWYKEPFYLDEDGKMTGGGILLKDWDKREKIKHENEFIEV